MLATRAVVCPAWATASTAMIRGRRCCSRWPTGGRSTSRGSVVAPARSARFYGPWIIAASFITFGLASGLPYYNIAFFYDYLRDDHHWTQQMVTLGAPVAILATIWAGPLL